MCGTAAEAKDLIHSYMMSAKEGVRLVAALRPDEERRGKQ